MVKKTSAKKMIEKFEIIFHAYDSRDTNATPSREFGLIFDRVGKTSKYKPCFIMHDAGTGLNVTLPLSEGNYEKLCDLFGAFDPSTVEGYIKKLMMMLNFISV